ncbi:Mitochondrial outer membrane protein om14 [Saccharomyces pastorianus]|uniref:Mitochondrial outer membrane protein om14 n=1 Tax=Saccharomyces pastorianus TaxID=27292 RepID=A0A6C1E4W6_SACPS|nr:OM14-like protein [Saccharomyces eubayanus]KOH00540.1 OM14-like protein [Saccharomyces eubayanus]QID84396.1 Mitochondrial outer membrane protein om14 [Saccharomyces pastorianus]
MTILLFPSAKHDNASPNAHPEDKGHHHNNKKDCAIEHLKARLNDASAAACSYLHAFVLKAQDVARVCLLELQNPVVLVNLVLHSSVLCYLCNGYANHNVRFLKGKPNSTVLTTTAGALGLLTLDGLISKKYYSRFDKK